MAEKTDEIEIEVDLPIKEDKADAEIAVSGDTKTIVTPEQGIEKLRAELESDRREKEQLRARATQAETEAAAAKNETNDTNLKYLTSIIVTLKNNQVVLKQRYAEAMAAGEFDKVADINLKMAETVHDLKNVEQGEKAYKERAKPPPKPQIADPVEAVASQLTPRSAAWVRNHPEYAKDPKLTRKMVRAHEDAMDDGIAPDSDDYFKAVEDRLGLSQASKQEIIVPDPMKEAAQVTQRRTSPPAAPVSRGTVLNGGSKANTVRLSAAEREAAVMFNPGMSSADAEREYAKNKLALIKENKLSSR